ncbi:carbohydrate ABC transporter permease [Bacillota bacterium Meth-B3]|nr:carbohydrate ABC transporter permease [Christensenellaceae bacterium]MEA5067572.1 carbohydrate ABC transporter permease [Christensenellaceae bacterium]
MHKKLWTLLKYLVLALGAVVVITPFWIMLLNSVKSANEIISNPLSLPAKPDFSGYVGVFVQLNIGRLFLNSIFVSASTMALNVLLSLTVAYGILKCNLPGKSAWRSLILSSMMLPSILMLIPQYQMFFQWGWINSFKVMILPVCISAYNIFLMMQFMHSISDEYLEAARMDGASEPFILYGIVLPLSLPAISTVGILSFMDSWNDFMRPLLYMTDQNKMTLQLAVFRFKTLIPNGHFQQLWAATTLVTVPIVIAFLCVQRNFIKAFTGVGLK